MRARFELEKYMGRWYDLLHYPSYFQPPDTYNTTADYKLLDDGTVDVTNTTYQNSERIQAHGTATVVDDRALYVEFDLPSIVGLTRRKKDADDANYLIYHIWRDSDNNYAFAVVSNEEKDSLWVLSREAHPSKENYEEVLSYINTHFDLKRVAATPHFDDK